YSMVALSVSISARMSPALTGSSSFLSHLARLPFSMVGDSAGIRMLIGIDSPSGVAARRRLGALGPGFGFGFGFGLAPGRLAFAHLPRLARLGDHRRAEIRRIRTADRGERVLRGVLAFGRVDMGDPARELAQPFPPHAGIVERPPRRDVELAL